jgi:hypothetical protein
MRLTKIDGKGILLTPRTAREQSFLDYLVEMIEARETKFLSDLDARLALLAPDSPPLKEVREP